MIGRVDGEKSTQDTAATLFPIEHGVRTSITVPMDTTIVQSKVPPVREYLRTCVPDPD